MRRSARRAQLGVHDGRLAGRLAPEMIEHRFSPLLARHLPAFQAVIRYNLAHVVMLRERGVVSRQTTVELVRVLSHLARAGPRGLRFSAELEDVYPNVEAEVIRRLGEQIGGALLTGRSRAEVQLTADRLLLRETIQELAEDLIAYARVLLGLASAHRDSYMPTYTFLQPAQPSTFGHYLLCHVEAARSDGRRLEAAYDALNRSPAEIGICTGTAFPVDRRRVARLLGFEGILENTLYALNSSDLDIEAATAGTLVATHLARLADDLYTWSSAEFGFVELGDEFCGTSFIMPQKKNPYALDHPKHVAMRALSGLNQVVNSYRTTPAQSPTEVFVVVTTVSELLQEVRASVRLMAAAVRHLHVDRGRMAERAGARFTPASALAELLVRDAGVSFRAAHRVVGTVVRQALAHRLEAAGITPAMIDQASRRVLGRPLAVPADALARAVDPRGIVQARRVPGGPGPAAMARACRDHDTALVAAERRWARCRQAVRRQERALDSAVARLLR